MMDKDRTKWSYFGEIFESVAYRGIDEIKAIETLLDALRNGLRAYGYRRQFTFDQSGKVERLPRDVHPQSVPIGIWRDSGMPRDDFTSHWQNDPEEPEFWISIDWITGCVNWMDWEPGNFESLLTEFSGVRIPQKEAEHLLGLLSGSPKRRAGRPAGPSNPKERGQVEAALKMIGTGDTRSITAIAMDLTDSALTGRALQSQRNRIAWGIKKAMPDAAKNPPKNKRE